MKITKALRNLENGTFIENCNGGDYIRLTSEYDERTGTYSCDYIELDEDGNETITGSGHITPADLIGNEI